MKTDACRSRDLGLDQACVVFTNKNVDSNYTLYALPSDCKLCPLKKIDHINNHTDISVLFSTQSSWLWQLFNGTNPTDFRLLKNNSDIKCQLKTTLGEYGVYHVTIDNDDCHFKTIKSAANSYIPLIIIFGIIIGALSLISLGKKMIKYWKKNSILKNDSEIVQSPVKKRVQSIDTFRGLSIMMMIFVNNGAGGYKILGHAAWNGIYVGDLVFAWFIWIMGFCIPIALSAQLNRGMSRAAICRKIVQRSFILFFLGVCLNTLGTDSNLEKIRIFGVLQRIGIAYLITGLSYVLLNSKGTPNFQRGFLAAFNDFISLLPQWIFMILILIAHCVITFCLKIPGCPKGYLGPGGLHDDGKYVNCTGGSAGYIDKLILGISHLYQFPTIDNIYQSGPFDPEGILGCLTTIIHAFLGVQAGKTLRVYKNWKSRIIRWDTSAIIYTIIGVILHFGNFIPINKNLWSISFVLLTTAFGSAVFSACYLLVDKYQVWNGGPFRVPGTNALVMYVGHQLCYQIFPFHWKYGEMNTHTWMTITALWDVGLWTIIAYILHHKSIYIGI